MDPNNQRAEAERWLGIAVKLLTARDFMGSKTFAIRAREADPNNAVSDQILAVVDTVLSAEKRVDSTQQPDWYGVLQLPRMVSDPDLIANHYRRLCLLLNPEHNRVPFSDYALQLVMDGWSVLSDPTKKWLFDNELALSLQRSSGSEPQRVEPVRSDPIRVDPGSVSSTQLNTFQFFQPQPQIWQQQMSQREFMQPQPQPQPQSQPQPQPQPQPPVSGLQQMPLQWQLRDPNPNSVNGGGDTNKESMIAFGIGGRDGNNHVFISSKTPPPSGPSPMVVGSKRSMPPPAPAPASAPQPEPPVRVLITPAPEVSKGVEDGNVGINVSNNNANNVSNNNAAGNDGGVNENREDVVEEVECFWTSCPYCFYIYEYPKKYEDCALRCQTCRRGFHALQIPKPPLTALANGGNEKEESSFCSWGVFPVGFSMGAWKKHNQNRNPKGASTWVPFSPMFACPIEKGGGNFQWFGSNGNASDVPKKGRRKSAVHNASGPTVYIDDEEALLGVSDDSDPNSSDHDWRNTYAKTRKHNKGTTGGVKRRRPRRAGGKPSQGNRDGLVYVTGDAVGNGSGPKEIVLGLVAAGVKTDANKNVASNATRKQTKRSVKDMGRLDLNVEFNNENDEHAPTVSAVNGEEDGIENICFFEGLDEFLSTLPILNVGGDEKTKPS